MNLRSNKYILLLVGILILIIIPLIIFLITLMFSGKSPTSEPSPRPSPTSSSPRPVEPRVTPFSTTSPTQNQNMQLQTQADKEYGDYFTQVAIDYPWFSELPIRTDDYFIFFSLSTKRFGGYLYPLNSSSEPVDAQVARLKELMLSRLASLGINMNQYQIDWKIFIK